MVAVAEADEEYAKAVMVIARQMVMDATVGISQGTNASAISAMTALLHANCQLLAAVGGKNSRAYMLTVAEAVFCKDRAELAKMNKRMRANLEKMADHYDLVMSNPTGSA